MSAAIRNSFFGGAIVIALIACSDDDKGGMDKAAYCSKCAECYGIDPYFQEGFCDPFWDGSRFDQDTCSREAESSEADSRSLSSSALEAMSCEEFDERI